MAAKVTVELKFQLEVGCTELCHSDIVNVVIVLFNFE